MIVFKKDTKTSGLIKALAAIAVGLFLVLTKANAMTLIVQIGAACLLVAGVIPLLFKTKYPSMEEYASGSIYRIVVAFIIFLLAGPVAGIIRYVLGGILCFFGVSMIINIVKARETNPEGILPYVFPAILVLVGLMFFSEELIGQDIMGLIAGLAFILYGFSKGWSVLKNGKNGPSGNYEDDSVDEQ